MANHATGNCGATCLDARRRMGVRRESFDVDAGKLLHDGRRGGAFDGQRAGGGGFVGQRGVVHDDEFVERGEGLLAQKRVAEDQDAVFERECFEFGLDVSLGVEQQADGALAGGEIAHVAGEHGVQVAGAIGSGEGKDWRGSWCRSGRRVRGPGGIRRRNRRIARAGPRRNMARASRRRRCGWQRTGSFGSIAAPV